MNGLDNQSQSVIRFFLERLFEVVFELIREGDLSVIGAILGLLIIVFIALILALMAPFANSDLHSLLIFLLTIPVMFLIWLIFKRADERGSAKDFEDTIKNSEKNKKKK